MRWEARECAGPYCDRKLYGVRSDARFCSDTCRQQAHRQRKAGVTAVTDNPAVTAVTAKSVVTHSVTDKSVEGDLDTEIAELAEKIRRALWWSAAMRWHSHYEDPWTPLFEDDDRPVPGQIYAWQKAIDTGRAQPATKYVRFADFQTPDRSWIGLGLDNTDVHLDYQDWWTVWDYIDDVIPDVLDQARQLQRRWIEREVHTLLMEGVDIDSLFDKEGDWKSEDQSVMLTRKSNCIVVPKPTFFTDDLVHKVDPCGAPDFARGWWDDDDEEDDEDEDDEDPADSGD